MIYFARIGRSGPIKIGYSKRPQARIIMLRTSSPKNIKLLAVHAGGVAAEHQLHHRFAANRVRGEWFKATPALIAYIREHGHVLESGAKRQLSYAERKPGHRELHKQKPQVYLPLAPGEVRAWRLALMWGQRRAAKWLGVSVHTYRGWEGGRRRRQSGPIRARMAQARLRSPSSCNDDGNALIDRRCATCAQL